MTIEEKAKRYDEAIRESSKILKYCAGGANIPECINAKYIIEQIFPELKESEERIVKWIINEIKIKHHNLDEDNVDFVDKAIAWLEKQGKQNPTDKVEPKFQVGDTIRLKNGDGLEWTVEKVLNNGYYTIVCADRDDFILLDDNWELIEQKSAWSEEDETMTTNIIIMLKEGASLHFNKKDIAKGVDWLKSLRPQNAWKPSDEQMEALWNVYQGGEEQAELATLYTDLKKLRNE